MDVNFHVVHKVLIQHHKPSHTMQELSRLPFFQKKPFKSLLELRDTQQSPKYHAEGNVWNHTMLVLDEAAKVRSRSKNPEVFMWAALLHDIGKLETTKFQNGKWTAYGHEKLGAIRAREFLQSLDQKQEFIKEVTAMVRWHMEVLSFKKNLLFFEKNTLKKEVDIREIALLSLCDRLGRLNVNRLEEMDLNKRFIDALERVD